jgi:hypothetical protein
VVLVGGTSTEALRWAISQPWIDVVTNSYGKSMTPYVPPAPISVRDNMYWGAPVADTRIASERGQTIVFSSGNGLANSYDVPMFTYWSSEKGPDWMVTVGAASPGTNQTYLGAGKPVDVSGIGRTYPSTGGITAAGIGFHSGTSNAAPMVAGYLATTTQAAREALGSTGPQQADGAVARGEPVACGPEHAGCPLGDGVLTRAELEKVVLETALPTEIRVGAETYPMVPTTPASYHYQGRGVFFGRIRDSWAGEREHMVGVLTGAIAPHRRPEAESNWFVVGSKCRQRLWGSWAYGVYQGVEAELDPVDDPLATTFDAWCSQLEEGFLPPS